MKGSRRTKYFRAHKINIKGISFQGGVDFSYQEVMEFDQCGDCQNMSQIPI